MDIRQELLNRRDRALKWSGACGILIVLTFVLGLSRGDYYTGGENTFVTIVMLASFIIGILTGVVATLHWQRYERFRQWSVVRPSTCRKLQESSRNESS